MKSFTNYINLLKQFNKNDSIRLVYRTEEETLWLENVPFISAHASDIFQKDFSEKGVLTYTLTQLEKDYCKKHNISYLTQDGCLLLIRKKNQLTIEPRKPTQRKKRNRRELTHLIKTPTHLISPNVFTILDVLFRLTESQIKNFRSGLHFSKHFELYQPKLSTLMLSVGARNLLELRKIISQVPLEWWISALQYPATRRVFTPFLKNSKPYHSVALEITQKSTLEYNHLINTLIKSIGHHQLAPGPTEVPKGLGLLRDTDFSIWGTEKGLFELKKKFRLVPGIEKNFPTWHLATPTFGIERESIFSHFPMTQKTELPHSIHESSNFFRAIWDLSFGDARLLEVQTEILKRILK